MGPKIKTKLSKRQKKEAADEAANGRFQKKVSRKSKRKTPIGPQSPTGSNEAQDTNPAEYNPYFPFDGPQRDFKLEECLEQGSSTQHPTSHLETGESSYFDPPLYPDMLKDLKIDSDSELNEPKELPEGAQSANLIPKGNEQKNLEDDHAQLRKAFNQIQLDKEQAETDGEVRLAAQLDINTNTQQKMEALETKLQEEVLRREDTEHLKEVLESNRNDISSLKETLAICKADLSQEKQKHSATKILIEEKLDEVSELQESLTQEKVMSAAQQDITRKTEDKLEALETKLQNEALKREDSEHLKEMLEQKKVRLTAQLDITSKTEETLAICKADLSLEKQKHSATKILIEEKLDEVSKLMEALTKEKTINETRQLKLQEKQEEISKIQETNSELNKDRLHYEVRRELELEVRRGLELEQNKETERFEKELKALQKQLEANKQVEEVMASHTLKEMEGAKKEIKDLQEKLVIASQHFKEMEEAQNKLEALQELANSQPKEEVTAPQHLKEMEAAKEEIEVLKKELANSQPKEVVLEMLNFKKVHQDKLEESISSLERDKKEITKNNHETMETMEKMQTIIHDHEHTNETQRLALFHTTEKKESYKKKLEVVEYKYKKLKEKEKLDYKKNRDLESKVDKLQQENSLLKSRLDHRTIQFIEVPEVIQLETSPTRKMGTTFDTDAEGATEAPEVEIIEEIKNTAEAPSASKGPEQNTPKEVQKTREAPRVSNQAEKRTAEAQSASKGSQNKGEKEKTRFYPKNQIEAPSGESSRRIRILNKEENHNPNTPRASNEEEDRPKRKREEAPETSENQKSLTLPPDKKVRDEEMIERLQGYRDYNDYEGKVPCNYKTGQAWNSRVARWADTTGTHDTIPDPARLNISQVVTTLLRNRKLLMIYTRVEGTDRQWEPQTTEDPHTERMWEAFKIIRSHEDYLEFCNFHWKEPSPGFCYHEKDNGRRCVLNCKNPDGNGAISVGRINQCLDHIMDAHSHLNKQGVYCLVCSSHGQNIRFKTPWALGEHLQKQHEKMFIMYSMSPRDEQPLNAMKAWQAFAQMVISRTLAQLEEYLSPDFFNKKELDNSGN